MDAAALFEKTMDWLRDSYEEHRFFVERDVVWTAQLRLLRELDDANLPYRALNDYTLFEKTRADLALLNGGAVEVAAEFKYEPSHARSGEFGDGKFPVVDWRAVEKDAQRVREYVAQGRAKTAYAVLIDEGGYFRKPAPSPESEWRDWGNGVWALWTKVDAGAALDALSSGEPPQVAAPGEWVPLPDLDVNLPAYPPPPSRLLFSDDSERPVNAWNDLLFGVAEWLVATRKTANGSIASGSKRDIINTTGVHPSGKDFVEPRPIAGTAFSVEMIVGKEQAKSHAIKLLDHCGVDPNDVLVLR